MRKNQMTRKKLLIAQICNEVYLRILYDSHVYNLASLKEAKFKKKIQKSNYILENTVNFNNISDLDIEGFKKRTINTYGDLKNLLNKDRRKNLRGHAKDYVINMLANLVPGGVLAVAGVELLRQIYYAKKKRKTNTRLDKLTVDPYTAEIVDDTVEKTFIEQFYDYIMKQPDSKPLEDSFNVDSYLELYLKNNFKGRHVAFKK